MSHNWTIYILNKDTLGYKEDRQYVWCLTVCGRNGLEPCVWIILCKEKLVDSINLVINQNAHESKSVVGKEDE